MRKKPGVSLTRLGDSALRGLHGSIAAAFPELAFTPEAMSARLEHHRKMAFNGTTSYRLFKHHYVRSQVLKRFQEGGISAEARKADALLKYHAAEEKCRDSNGRLCGAFEASARLSDKHIRYLRRARAILSAALGEFDLTEFVQHCQFSNGATTEFCRRDASVQHKWAQGSHITENCLPLLRAFDKLVGSPFDHVFSSHVVEGGEVFTVLKNFKTDRICDKQPTLNVFFQKGVGSMLRVRAWNEGLLRPDAQQYHARLAQEASMTGRLTTDDLVSASDTVCLALGELLLSGKWAGAVYLTRCAATRLPSGETVTLEKVSSMGNGFTFELETWFFYVLLRAVCGKDACISVYGDDLIYPTEYVSEVREFLSVCGFEINLEKSFSTGPFRESCGGHYFSGHSVKPFYIEKLPRTYGQVINLHNDIVAYHSNMPPNKRYLEIARQCRRLIPKKFWGPCYTDGVLWSEWDEATPRYKKGAGRKTPLYSYERRSDHDPNTDFVRKITGYAEGPVYQHWVVNAIVYVVPTQRHDYYMGSLLSELWKRRQRFDRARVTKSFPPKWLITTDLGRLPEDCMSNADFWFPAAKREKIVTRVIDVACRWPHMPVRV